MKNKLTFEDLEVYKKLCDLHLKICDLTFEFPKFEINEIGSDLRRSSNSAPACIAEGYSNKNIRHYMDKIEQALSDIRQTKHYINIIFKKGYIEKDVYSELIKQYDECSKKLKTLIKSINSRRNKNNHFTKNQFPNSNHL
jgi:four helix bundle protein